MTFYLNFIFFVSGISGLIYQVIWVREFGQIFGNTVSSASLVAGTFVFGLGLGSYLAGKFIDRKHSTDPSAGLRYYIKSELFIAILGLFISVAIPQFQNLSPLITFYTPAENGWMELSSLSYILRLLIALILIAPITIIMGATLTLLIRFIMSNSVQEAGWKIGLLYGANTFGAAIGCAIVDIWAGPSIGLINTKLVAIFLNLIACLLAYWLLKKQKFPANKNVPTISESHLAHGKNWYLRAGCIAIAISGFAAMGMEIVWFRFLSSLFSGRRLAFSMLLVTILIGMWLGAICGGYITKKWKSSTALPYIYSQLLFVVATIGGFFIFINTDKVYLNAQLDAGALSGQSGIFYLMIEQLVYAIPALKIVLFPSVMMGAAFPLINVFVQKNKDSVGKTAGSIYLWNSVGAILGSLMTGFIFLPFLGMQTSTAVLCILAAIAVIPVIITELTLSPAFKNKKQGPIGAFVIVVLGILMCFITSPADLLTKNIFLSDQIEAKNKTLLRTSEGINEIAMVVESKGDGSRDLFTDGHSMSGTNYTSQRYMRAFAHLPLLQLDSPTRALVICFGVGNTTHSVSLHPSITNIDVVDISKNVLGLAGYFESANANVLSDPRTQVFINDGRQHLRMETVQAYDLITLEPPPLVSAGVASLYSKEFYQLANNKLKSGGYITQWLPIYQIDGEHARQLVKAFMDVFPNGVLLNGFGRELILMGQKDGPNQIDWQSMEQKVSQRPLVAEDLKRIDLSTATEWLGTFMASSIWLKENLESTLPLSDNLPIIEYNRYHVVTRLPGELFQPASLPGWCPSCFENGNYHPRLELLDSYLSLMNVVYKSDSYLEIGRTGQFVNLSIPYVQSLSPSEQIIRGITRKNYNRLLGSYPALTRMFGPASVSEAEPGN
ncbi:MAG: fused MFS/spermidine synthase [Bdellovibrionota bacterium]